MARLGLIRVLVAGCAAAASLAAAAPGASTGQGRPAWADVGRAPTPAELKAWDIDVRGDFRGLPKGSGSVEAGAQVWEAKCASCHGPFGESNQVFTPIVGGTTKKDIESGRVAALSTPGYPHRTTLMKISKLSSIWDYINRAMPWNAPKSLKTDEVYGLVAYILNLGDIVPSDFILTERNIADVEKRLPNRDGHFFYEPMWLTKGKGDVRNPVCMHDCGPEAKVTSTIPAAALNSNGNIADQVRPFGPARGADTAKLAQGSSGTVQALAQAQAPAPAKATAGALEPSSSGSDGSALIKSASCTACHGIADKIVGPAFQDVAKKHAARADAVEYLAGKIKAGSQGVWGPIPMPPQQQVSDPDVKSIAQWLAAGAKP